MDDTPRGRRLLEAMQGDLPGLRPLEREDFPALLGLYRSNPFFNSVSLDAPPTLENCREDAGALPPGREPCHKLFLGLFQEGRLRAALDLVEGYPQEATLYIGLLELDGAVQRQGLGTRILDSLEAGAKEAGFGWLRLACLEKNLPGYDFWKKQGFQEEGRGVWQGGRTVLKMVRAL